MIEVSSSFKKAVYSKSRKTHALVRFEILDTTAYKDNTITINDQESFSKYNQLTNKVREPSIKIGTFEKDYFKLDGSFCLSPTDTSNDLEIGYWSNNLCDGNGLFSPYETITFTFTEEHSSMGITIAFDVLNNEYAEQFNVYFYDTSNTLIKTINVTDNDSSTYESVEQLDDYTKIVIEIVKWCTGYRRAKIVEVDFGIIRTYTDDTLISMSLVQEIDNTSSSLPSDELKFTVDNSSKWFNILNPDGYCKYIQQGQEVFLSLGVELDEDTETFEDVQVGKFYLSTLQSDEGTLTTTFTSNDILDLLSDDESENTAISNMTLYNFAVKVFNECGIDNYKISNNLKLINTNGLYQSMTYRNLIQLIAIAGMCVIYSNSNGAIEIKQLTDARSVFSDVEVTNVESSIGDKDDIMDNIMAPDVKYLTLEKDFLKLDGSFKVPVANNTDETGWISSTLSDENGNFATPLVITINLTKEQTGNNLLITFDTLNLEYATDFIIQAYDSSDSLLLTDSISTNSSSSFSYENNNLVGAKVIVVTLTKWCKGYRRARVFEIGFNEPVDYISFDNTYEEPKITTNDVVKAVKITYYPTDLDNSVTYTYTDSSIKSGSTVELENSLINTEADAINVAKWIIQENSKGVNTVSFNWRGNPALELADKVTIQNGYSSTNVINITKNELNYQGYLSGKLEGRGVS